MHEITCPHCGKAFKIDEAGYADILKQIRDREFDSELHERLESAVELAKAKVSAELEKEASKKDVEIERLKQELKASEAAKLTAVDLAETKIASTLKEEAGQ